MKDQLFKMKKTNPPLEDTKKLLLTLFELGLNKYEARVYLALIYEGTATAKNVSDTTGIPYGKVYEIINQLCKKGFSILLPTKPMKYKAISPMGALETTKKKVFGKFEKLQEEVLTSLHPIFEQKKEFSESSGFFWVLNGRRNIIKKVDELIENASKYIYVFGTENGLKRIGIHKDVLQAAAKRGIKTKIVGSINQNNKEDLLPLQFCDLYRASNASTQLVVIDGTSAVLVEAIPDDDSIVYGRDVGVLITNNTFSKFLEDAFLSKMNQSKKYTFN